jgi:hypothetical protein
MDDIASFEIALPRRCDRLEQWSIRFQIDKWCFVKANATTEELIMPIVS